MAPVAIDFSSDFAPIVTNNYERPHSSAKGSALVIGSPSTAQNGLYQKTISDLEATRRVERQMIDRLLDGGKRILFDADLWNDFKRCIHRQLQPSRPRPSVLYTFQSLRMNILHYYPGSLVLCRYFFSA